MQSCSSNLCIPILLATTIIIGSEITSRSVKVKVYHSATLPCSKRCSGLVRWTVPYKHNYSLAECDQTSCTSKEGYQMIHDQYLMGDFSLFITAADPGKSTSYTCQCDGKDICYVNLQEEGIHSVTVNLHDSATLSCSERCSGLVTWTVSHKPRDALAECNQTSCRSVKEGYQMIHDQYLKGNLSLIITDADFSKRGWYTCQCDDKDLCDVRLQIEPLNTTVHLKPSESLFLDLENVSDPVEVIYNSRDAAFPSSGQICTVEGHSSQCKSEYTRRMSFSLTLELRGVKPSDSGVYTIRNRNDKEVIHTYTVTVQDDQPHPDSEQGAAVLELVLCVMAVVLIACLVSIAGNIWLCKEKRRLQMNAVPRDVASSQCTEDRSLSYGNNWAP